MTSGIYLVHALGWSASGAVVGVLLDRGVLALQQIARATTQEEPVAAPDQPAHGRKLQRQFGRSVVPAVLVVLAIVTAVTSVVTARTNNAQDMETRRVVACQAAYANGFADALEARSTATTEAQNALDDLMATVGQLTTSNAGEAVETRERFRAALAAYLGKRAEAKKQQQQNPYPPPPRDLCK